MPPYDRVGLDEDQRLTPIPPGVSEQDSKESVTRAKPGVLDSALQSGQLLAKRQVLKSHGSMTRADQTDYTEEDNDRRQHGPSCRRLSNRFNRQAGPATLWANDTIHSEPVPHVFTH